MEKEENKNKAGEPETTYNAMPKKNKIYFFNSLEEMEADQLTYFASLTPLELLANLKTLVKMSFGIKEEPPIETLSKRITFITEE